MSDSFHGQADHLLQTLTDYAESVEDAYGLDVDHVSEILTITLHNRLQYVINKHGVSKQVWLSSPFSGAHHYDYRDGRWIDSRDGHEILDLLMRELSSYAA